MAGQIVQYPFSTQSSKIQHLFPSIFTFVGNPHTVASVCKAWNSFLTKKDNSNFYTQWCLELAYTHGCIDKKAVDLRKMRELLDKDYGICNVSLEVAGDAERVKIIWQQYLVEGRRLCEDSLFNELARSNLQRSPLPNLVEDEKEVENQLEPLGLQHCRWIDSFVNHEILKELLTEEALKEYGSNRKKQISDIFDRIYEEERFIYFLNEYIFITNINGGIDFLKRDNRDDFESQYSFLRSNKSEVISWIKKQEIERLEIRDNRLIYLSHLIKHFPQLKTLVLASNKMKALGRNCEFPDRLENLYLEHLQEFRVVTQGKWNKNIKHLVLSDLSQFIGFERGVTFPNVTEVTFNNLPTLPFRPLNLMEENLLFWSSKPGISKIFPNLERVTEGPHFNQIIYQKGDKLPEIFSFIATVVSVCGLFYIHFLASILGGWPYYLSQGAVALQSFIFPMVEGNRDYTRVALRSLIGVSILFLGEDLRQQVLKQQVPLIFGWKLLVCFPLFWGAVGALYTHLKERRII